MSVPAKPRQDYEVEEIEHDFAREMLVYGPAWAGAVGKRTPFTALILFGLV